MLQARSADTNDTRPLVVANTHIHWNPEMCDVKLMQVAFLLEALQNLVKPESQWRNAPIVICGDFNLTPASGAFELLVNKTFNVVFKTKFLFVLFFIYFF